MTDLHSDSVRLVATTIDQLNHEDVSGEALALCLGVGAPPSWPPLYNGPETREWMHRMLLADVGNAGWFGWYVIASIDGVATLSGTAGYKGPPDVSGEVEIGYSIIPEHQRRGLASAAVRLLCRRAFDKGATAVLAETLPELIASQGVLTKTGFTRFDTRVDPEDGEIWRYRLPR